MSRVVEHVVKALVRSEQNQRKQVVDDIRVVQAV